jgi:ketosteroid isomerase-like protein
MSQENVDRFVNAIEAFNRGDVPGVLRFMDSEVRFEHRLAALQGEFVGLDGVRGWFTDLAEHFDDLRINCPDVRDLGDRVLGLGTLRATGKESGAETEQTFAAVARYRDGRVTEFIDFGKEDQALEAAGLSEKD